jgi:hypothetical protein
MKRQLALILTLTWSTWTFCQESTEPLTETNLTYKEWRLLDSILIDDKDNFSFEKKNTAFVSGHSATDIEDKEDFFKVFIYDYLNKGLEPIVMYRLLDQDQKQASGGYDVIVLQIPKILTDKQLAMNIQKLGELEKLK